MGRAAIAMAHPLPRASDPWRTPKVPPRPLLPSLAPCFRLPCNPLERKALQGDSPNIAFHFVSQSDPVANRLHNAAMLQCRPLGFRCNPFPTNPFHPLQPGPIPHDSPSLPLQSGHHFPGFPLPFAPSFPSSAFPPLRAFPSLLSPPLPLPSSFSWGVGKRNFRLAAFPRLHRDDPRNQNQLTFLPWVPTPTLAPSVPPCHPLGIP